ncbi:MAG: AMP-binding protein, partial [Sphingomicrobium sp.]
MTAYDSFVRDRLPSADLLPEFRFDLPELDYPERLNAAAELLKGGAPDDLAIVNDHGRWTYRELDDFSGRIARLLVDEHGLIPGNRVFLRGPNGYTIYAAWLGVLKAGGVVVATMPLLRPGEIATVLERAEISHAIVDSRFIGDFREGADQARTVEHVIKFDGDYGHGELESRTRDLAPLPPADTGRDDPAIIAFTSGTTGIPKGCVQFHRDILASCDTFAKHIIGPKPGDIFLTSAPMAFTFGLGITPLFPLRFGAASATLDQANPPALLEAIAKFGVTHLGTAPTAYKAMLSQPALDNALTTLTTCISAGEHLPKATWEAWKERTGLSIIDGIGATEMMHIFISASGDDIRPGSTGKAVPGYEATVLDEAGNPMDEGEGRLAIKGPTGCRYLDDERQANYV